MSESLLAGRVPAVSRAAAVLQAVCESGGPLGLADLTDLVGAPKSSVMGICHALTEHRVLIRGVDGTYIAGPRIFEFGSTARANGNPLRSIGFSYPDDESFFLAELAALRAEAGRLGARVDARPARQQATRQQADIAEFVAARVDLVLVEPVVSHGLEPAFAAARAARIPVVAVGSATNGVDGVVATDNTSAGALAGTALVKALNGRGSIAVVQGTPVTANADRVAGFLGVIDAQPDMVVTATGRGELDEHSGERVAKEIIDERPAIDGFFACNDQIALGIAHALADRGASVPIVSVDGGRGAVEQIRSNGMILASSAQDPARLMRTAIDLGSDLHTGLSVARRSIFLAPRLIDAENVEGYAPWG